jgi:hypothetical protein
MEIIITQWALDAYLELKDKGVFSDDEYRNIIRPEVLLLRAFPNDPRFKQPKFWSPADDQNGKTIANGYKMKWHNMGNGNVQLRLTVGILNGQCFLCEAYDKQNSNQEARKLARFKTYLQLIRLGNYIIRGRLS